eukprot:scaffold3725_cov48-Phaeocystis_antarctica.AAC.1
MGLGLGSGSGSGSGSGLGSGSGSGSGSGLGLGTPCHLSIVAPESSAALVRHLPAVVQVEYAGEHAVARPEAHRPHLVRRVDGVVVQVGDVPSARPRVAREHQARRHLRAREQRRLLGRRTVLPKARLKRVSSRPAWDPVC